MPNDANARVHAREAVERLRIALAGVDPASPAAGAYKAAIARHEREAREA